MENIIDILSRLFTPEQQLALGIITISVMVLLQVFKNVYFGYYPERRKARKRAILWLMAFVIGIACGVAGHFIAQPPQPLWFWMFTGATSGGGAIGAFKVFVEIDWRGIIHKAFTR